MLALKVIQTLPEIEALKDEWLALLERTKDLSLFQRPEWNICWLKCFAENRSIYFLTIRDDEKLVGIAPMIQCKRALEFIGAVNFASDYADFIIEDNREDVRVAIIEKLLIEKKNITLKNIPTSSPSIPLIIKKLNESHCFYLHQISADTPAYFIKEEADKKKLLSHKSLKRHFNVFKRDGTLKHLTKAEEIKPWLEPFFRQHIERWHGKEKSLFCDPNQRKFYELLTEELSSALIFTVLENGTEPLAFHFGFNYQGKFYWYKPSFNIKYKQRSPGEALLQSLFQYTVDHDLKIFDFTVGNEGFKYRFSNTINTNSRIVIFKSRLPYLVAKARSLLGWLKRSLIGHHP